jgi:hypothetical protein
LNSGYAKKSRNKKIISKKPLIITQKPGVISESHRGVSSYNSSSVSGAVNFHPIKIVINSIKLNSGANHTSDRNIVIDISASKNATEMRMSESESYSPADITTTNWEPFRRYAPFTLSPGNGVKNVFVQLRTPGINGSNVLSKGKGASIEFSNPYLEAFSINNGEETTSQRQVTLNPKMTGNAREYRVALSRSGLTSSTWQRVNSNMNYTLPARKGNYRLFFQARGDGAATESRVLSDTIRSLNMIEYEISGADAYNFAILQGFRFSAQSRQGNSSCSFKPRLNSWLEMWTKGTVKVDPAKCQFNLFQSRRLNSPWSFSRFEWTLTDNAAVANQPNENAAFAGVRLNTQKGFGISSRSALDTIVIRGPEGSDWRDAFQR